MEKSLFFLPQQGSVLFQGSTLPLELLVLIVALGLLLIIVLAVIGISMVLRLSAKHKGASREKIDTQPKTAKVKSAPDDILPTGTSLLEGMYEIEAFVSRTSDYDIFRTKRTQPQYLCPHCGVELTDDTSAFCRVCGAELGVVPPTYGSYLLKEFRDPKLSTQSERLVGMNLHHPSLILPIASFEDSPFDSPRYYLVEPYKQAPLLSSIKMPLPVKVVLDIGINLAEGLSYLHNYSAVIKRIDMNSIVYTDEHARWLCYGNVRLLAPENQDTYAVEFSQNVRDLTLLLKLLLDHTSSTTTPLVIPDAVQELLQHYSEDEGNHTAGKLARSLRQAKRMLGGHNLVRFRLGAGSDVGRLRKLNEDSMLLRDFSTTFQNLGVAIVIGAVADGVGGHAAGDVASQTTIASIENRLDELPENAQAGEIPDAETWVSKAAEEANERVFRERNEAGNNMACTLVLAFFTGDMATILNVGDSRAYLLNERGIRQITTDHSLVERLVSIGEITRDEARHHPRKSVIYRVIGDRLRLDYDIFTQTFVPGEALLMCSDGLTDMVEDGTIWRIWRAASSPDKAVEQLVEEANTAGGTDNITVVIIEVEK